ncbi:hypothetical protein BH18GEM1_BH18GEM1_06250 [soil metagenome]
MSQVYLVDLLVTEERSATVLVEADDEREARELALVSTPEGEYGCLDSENEVRIVEVPPCASTASTGGDYEIVRLLRIDRRGRIRYGPRNPRGRELMVSVGELDVLRKGLQCLTGNVLTLEAGETVLIEGLSQRMEELES